MHLRLERPGDAEAINAVHSAAFPHADGAEAAEARLVKALRNDGALVPGLSIVAEHNGKVVGHVACSYGSLGGHRVAGLAPIGVSPELQGTGVGSALMHAVIAAADALGEPCLILLGDPGFYARYGFSLAGKFGVPPQTSRGPRTSSCGD